MPNLVFVVDVMLHQKTFDDLYKRVVVQLAGFFCRFACVKTKRAEQLGDVHGDGEIW